jgi:hypothetical protein
MIYNLSKIRGVYTRHNFVKKEWKNQRSNTRHNNFVKKEWKRCSAAKTTLFLPKLS